MKKVLKLHIATASKMIALHCDTKSAAKKMEIYVVG